MARLYIGYDQLGPRSFRNVRKDMNRYPLILMEEDSQEDLTLDFTGYLEASETISSSATSDVSGITLSTPTVSSPKVTITLSSPTYDGEATITTTTSTGSKQVTIIRVRRPSIQEEQEFKDYC